MKRLIPVVLLALMTIAPASAADLSFNQTPTSLAMKDGEKIVWQYNYPGEGRKSYFHPLTLAGGETLTDDRPADHPIHHGLWFAFKYINGMMYWGEDLKTGQSECAADLTSNCVTTNPDHSARFEQSFAFHPQGKPVIMTENREIVVSAPADDGSYAIDWTSTFTAGDEDVQIARTPIEGQPGGKTWGGYGGFSFRGAPATRTWEYADSEGPTKEKWKKGRWMSLSGKFDNGQTVSVVIFDHPTNMRHPTPWYMVPDMPYLNAAVLYFENYTLPAKQSLSLKYRVLFRSVPVDGKVIDRLWQQFAETEGGK